MEHASIAAFARFALQLLAVGAPPDLVEGAQSAMADETVHAQLAFALASAYAGADIGPGPLHVDAALDGASLRELVVTTFAEGCVGETVAAIEALEALEGARDPQVRAVLEKVAADETRHAELAWRTVAWALGAGGERVHGWLEEAVAQAKADVRTERDALEANGGDLIAHGLVDASLSRRLRREALADVVLPCAKALLATRPAPGHCAQGCRPVV